MKLWRKFCNLDIIGKICILILLFIVIVATITVVARYTSQEKNDIETNQGDLEQQTVAFEEKSQNVESNNNLVTDKDNNTVVEETETSNQYEESEKIAITSTEKQTTNAKKGTTTQTSQQSIEKVSTTSTNQQLTEKVENDTQTKSNFTEIENTEEIQLDFSKYDRYVPGLNGGYSCFKKSDSEIMKLKGLIDEAISTFGYKNVKIIQNKGIAMSTRYFTANRTNVENKVYNSEDFTIYYYAEAEYTLSSKGVENLIQYRSYITVR